MPTVELRPKFLMENAMGLKAIFVALMFFGMSACSYKYEGLENSFSEALLREKTTNGTSLNLVPIFGEKWEKICIQGPYLPKSDFEKSVGREVDGYEMANEGVYNFWIFYSDGSQRWISVPRVKVMDKHPKKGSMCTYTSNPFIYFENFQESKVYFFR